MHILKLAQALRGLQVFLLVLLLSLPAGAAVHALKGYASYYSPRFHGRCCTASGEAVNVYAMTAAHRTLPLGSVVRVTNLKNRRSVVVRINDRGPYGGGRVIDLSLAAFKALAATDKGMIRVQLQVL